MRRIGRARRAKHGLPLVPCMRAVGFISEHTAEYVLVPALTRILAASFSRVVPIYFWSTREGSNLGRRCMSSQPIRLVAVYARRPKIEELGQNHILVKLNAELFEYARVAKPLGIPVFAGVPLVSSLAELTLKSQCSWFRLAPDESQDRDTELRLTLSGARLDDDRSCVGLEGPLESGKLVESVLTGSERISWEQALEKLREIRQSVQRYGLYGFFGGYKPFHLLLFDD